MFCCERMIGNLFIASPLSDEDGSFNQNRTLSHTSETVHVQNLGIISTISDRSEMKSLSEERQDLVELAYC